MDEKNLETFAIKENMQRILEKLNELHSLMKEQRKDWAYELRFWRRRYGGKKLWQIINGKTN
ncbi:MAG: hypothetical protein HY746_08095 [Elusimicrobia bacterium]|nr:hypothetical protein [Elusimicrobiota bacterium]